MAFITMNPKRIITMGAYSYGKPKIIFDSSQYTVTIGKFCSIAKNVTFLLASNHQIDFISTFPFASFFPHLDHVVSNVTYKGNIIVGNDVWIGYGATILPGISIGNGAIIGAMSVVTKDVSDYAIVAGNPAREIRKRFDDTTIKKFLKQKWWNYDIAYIQKNIRYFTSRDTKKFLRFEKKS